jgi:hypothetical protein
MGFSGIQMVQSIHGPTFIASNIVASCVLLLISVFPCIEAEPGAADTDSLTCSWLEFLRLWLILPSFCFLDRC